MNPRNITSAHSIDRIILLFLGRAGYILIRPVQEEGVCAASSLFLFPDPSRARSDRPTLPLSPKMPPAGDDYEPTMGAVQLLVHRRLRTVQKRVAKIAKAEEKRSAGGEIDDQQKELIDGKPVTMALLEEFTKLSQEVVKAVEEDRLAVLREERAKVAAKAERSAARRAAAAGDRPDEATKANEASAAPPVPPVDGGATRTTGKRQGKRGVRESPADGGAPPAREPTAATSNQPPAEIPQADGRRRRQAEARARRPRQEQTTRGRRRRRRRPGACFRGLPAPARSFRRSRRPRGRGRRGRDFRKPRRERRRTRGRGPVEAPGRIRRDDGGACAATGEGRGDFAAAAAAAPRRDDPRRDQPRRLRLRRRVRCSG